MFKVIECHPKYPMFSECHCIFYRLSSSYFLIFVMEFLTDEVFVEYWFCPIAKKAFFFVRVVLEMSGKFQQLTVMQEAGIWRKKARHHLCYVFMDFMTTVMCRKTLLIEWLDLDCCSLVTSKFSTPSTQLHHNMFKSLTRSDLSIHTSGYIFTPLCMDLNN